MRHVNPPLTGLLGQALTNGMTPPRDLEVPHRECLAITGPSGSGKSLLMRMLADLLPHEGKIWLDGAAQRDTPAPLWRRRVAYVATEAAWWAPTVAEHFPANHIPDTALLLLRDNILALSPERLSTGERQRLNLLRAMAGEPRVLVLDEPTSALDHEAVLAVEGLLQNWRAAGGILILSSHDPAQVERLATRHLVLEGARR